MSRLESLFGGNKKDVLRIAKDGKLDVGIPLNRQVDTEASDRATASFKAVLRWKNGNNEDRSVTAFFRALAARTGTTWTTRRCLIDDDAGARY